MVKLCIVADTHRRHRELQIPECDLLIHCGDFCSFGRDDDRVLDDVDSWFAEQPAKEIVCIGGNHDFMLQRREFRFTHATYLEDSITTSLGLKIYGTPWCPDLSGFAFYAPEPDLVRRWSDIPSGIDILVTHTPPHGVLDIPSGGGIQLGCPHLRQAVRRIQPQLHVFGHVHASYGEYVEDDVRFVNAAVVGGRDFEVRNPPVTLAVNGKPQQASDGDANPKPC